MGNSIFYLACCDSGNYACSAVLMDRQGRKCILAISLCFTDCGDLYCMLAKIKFASCSLEINGVAMIGGDVDGISFFWCRVFNLTILFGKRQIIVTSDKRR